MISIILIEKLEPVVYKRKWMMKVEEIDVFLLDGYFHIITHSLGSDNYFEYK